MLSRAEAYNRRASCNFILQFKLKQKWSSFEMVRFAAGVVGLIGMCGAANAVPIQVRCASNASFSHATTMELRATDTAYLPNGIVVPYSRLWIKSASDESVLDLNWKIFSTPLQSDLIAPMHDTPTANDSRYNWVSSAADAPQSVSINGEKRVDGQRYLELLIPERINRHGVHEQVDSIELRAGERLLQTSQLVFSLPSRSNRQSSAAEVDRLAILYPQSLAAEAESLAIYRRSCGVEVVKVEVDQLLASETGRDDPEKIRAWLVRFSASGGTAALLVGDEQLIPMRYLSHLSRTSLPARDQLIPSDLYYAGLSGDWNADGDSVWGEPYNDGIDLTPELYVGRLPFNSPAQVLAYLHALKIYEHGDFGVHADNLRTAYFFTSDQMRDHSNGGQHAAVARSLHSFFRVDTLTGVEASRGSDLLPSNPTGEELVASGGVRAGIVHVQAHGAANGFVVRSSGINQFPKSSLISEATNSPNGLLGSLCSSAMPSFWYSIACDNGAIDKDSPPFSGVSHTMPQTLLGDSTGVVGLVAYSRWGWVGTSFLMERAFVDSLRVNPGRPAIEAMYASQAAFPYNRDIVYGQQFFGDPLVRIWQAQPDRIELSVVATDGGISVAASRANGSSPEGIIVRICDSTGAIMTERRTDESGLAVFAYTIELSETYLISAEAASGERALVRWRPAIGTSIEDESNTLPEQFALSQNFPNPFNPVTTIQFVLPATAETTLDIFNLLGQQVDRLIEAKLPAGVHTCLWDGTGSNGQTMASGVYYYRLVSNGQAASRSMLLVK